MLNGEMDHSANCEKFVYVVALKIEVITGPGQGVEVPFTPIFPVIFERCHRAPQDS